jgi:uncharacterized membrane protein YjgN (DUF898 family)
VVTAPTKEADQGIATRLAFHGRGGSLFGIHVVNVLLTLLTLGVYFFWAKARVRRYVFAQTELGGDRFAFHGRGGEMLIGFLKAAVVFGVPLGTLHYLPAVLAVGAGVRVAASVAAYLILLVLVPMARVGARRYRMSRTSWRGIRFSFAGRTTGYLRVFVPSALLLSVTLGLAYPFYLVRTHAFMTRHSRFGSAAFDFDGEWRELLVDFLYAVLLTLPTVGFVWFSFVARKRRFLWSRTRFRGARFHCTVTGWRLFRLKLGNALILVATLGLGWPFARVRTARFVCRHLGIQGTIELTGVDQDIQIATATADGLLGLLEADLDLG